ncbi:MAG: winged helix-turn-helix transcriptional regulator, partial [Chloroflexota bacterium]
MYQYGQYCPVARATEILGDRWTLLIVRDLLKGTACRTFFLLKVLKQNDADAHVDDVLATTPHNGYTDTFASFLRMLDVGTVDGPLQTAHPSGRRPPVRLPAAPEGRRVVI